MEFKKKKKRKEKIRKQDFFWKSFYVIRQRGYVTTWVPMTFVGVIWDLLPSAFSSKTSTELHSKWNTECIKIVLLNGLNLVLYNGGKFRYYLASQLNALYKRVQGKQVQQERARATQ